MSESKKVVRRPFHETIAVAIRHAFSAGDMESLSILIKGTKIPKGHNEIIVAWKQRARDLGLPSDALGVLADLLEQKKEAEAEARAKKEIEERLLIEDALER